MALVAITALAVSDTTVVARSDARATALAAEPAPSSSAVGVEPRHPPIPRRPTERARSFVPYTLVRIIRPMDLTARPGAGRVVGTMPRGSRYYAQPLVAWVLETTPDGRYGLAPVPYAGREATGWMRLRGLDTSTTRISVVADLSEHRIVVRRGPSVLFRAPTATGAPDSPTPAGRYFVTDRVPLPGGGSLGTFAFGISGIQTRLPAGWSGGDQLAIHGTSAPATIGTSSSAGCLRVSERVLARLRPLLRPGTPVVVVP